MLDHTAPTWLRRLLVWLERFEDSFSTRAQRGALRRYVLGVLSDSRRKSMAAMWARLSEPGSYEVIDVNYFGRLATIVFAGPECGRGYDDPAAR